MARELKVDIREHKNVAGIDGRICEIRVAMIDPQDPRDCTYDKMITFQPDNKAAKLQAMDGLIHMLSDAPKSRSLTN